MRKLILLTVVLLTAVVANAQRLVSGKVVEQDTQEAVIQATASILSGEKIVANALTNMHGGFSIRAPRDGKYTLKITYVGFKTYTKQINIRDGKDYSAGTITMEPDAIMLKGATVTARASKVTLKADTFMYNASAFRTPEGSVVEELVKRLPGAEVRTCPPTSSSASRPTISRATWRASVVFRTVRKRRCSTSASNQV